MSPEQNSSDYSLDVDTCPSGCISTETCVSISLIDALERQARELVEATSPSAVSAMEAVHGNAEPLVHRDRVNEATKSALLASCRLMRLATGSQD